MAKTVTKTSEIEVATLQQGEVTFCVLGTSPFYCNRVQEKTKRILLMPPGRMTAGQKANNLKHDPLSEYRNSPYRRIDNGPTRIMMKSTAFKGAIAQAAIDMPTDVSRAQINRLVYVVDEYVPIWGVPRLDMDIVRSADIAKTPDIRTRARIDNWASRIRIRYIMPMLNENSVATLLAASGIICGVGDFRQQKGKGSNGLYEIVAEDDERWLKVIREGDAEAQDAALADPECSNSETEELLHWYNEEMGKRRKPSLVEAAD